MATDGYAGTMEALYKSAGLKNVAFHADATGTAMSNSIIDVLYKLSESGWDALADSFPNLSDSIATTACKLKRYQLHVHLKYFRYTLESDEDSMG